MPTLEIPAGETERLIPDDQSGRRYKLQVLSGKVSLGHTERYADDGRVYGPGASGIVERLQDGDSDRPHLFAFAHETAEVQLDSVGFLFDLFSTQPAQERSVNITSADTTLNTDINSVNTTLDTNIQSADATVNTDIVGSNTTLDTDIVSQSVGDLGIDIVNQSVGDLGVDISNQSIGELGIDIQSQSISDLGIDIQGQSVGEIDQNQSRRAADSVVTYESSGTIAAGNTEIIEESAPSGKVRELLDTRFTISPTGTNTPSSGGIEMELTIEGGLNELLQASADSTVIDNIIYSNGEFYDPADYSNVRPSNAANQPVAKMRHFVDDSTAFRWRFDNGSDVEYEYDISAVFKDTQT